MAKLTKREIDRAEPGATRYTIYDDEIRGFGVRVFPGGQKSYVLEYRPGAGGRGVAKRRMTIGVYGSDLTPDAARKLARDMLADIRRGDDPAAGRKHSRAMPTFRDFGEEFLTAAVESKLLKPRSVSNYATLLRKFAFPAFGSSKLNSVTTADVRRLHREMGKKQPTNANRMVAAVGAVYRYACDAETIPPGNNPAHGIAKFKEEGRERFLTIDELGRLGAALREGETIGLPWQRQLDTTKKAKHRRKPENQRTKLSSDETIAIRLLLFTGCRLREILHARWSDVDLERGLLNLADSKTGRRSIILSGPALAALGQHSRSGDYVVAGANPKKPRADLKRPWALITARADLGGLRLHDLRHTFASVGVGGGMGLPVIGKLLGHADIAVTQRYAHLEDTHAKRATDLIAGGIAAALGAQACTSAEGEMRESLA